MPQPGRNDPCSCGSGRKYKQCCLLKADAADEMRVRLRRAEGRIIEALLAFSLDRFGKNYFQAAWSDFFLGDQRGTADRFDDVPEFENMFMPWYALEFVRDPHGDLFDPTWPEEPLGLYWLRTVKPALDEIERQWLLAACASPISIFVVTGVDPGRSLDIRDLLTSRTFHVLEFQASQTVQTGDLIFTRVVTVAGVSLMLGLAPRVLPPRLHIEVLDFRDDAIGPRVSSREDLFDYNVEIRGFYLELTDPARYNRRPQLANTDGDPFVQTTLTFDLTVPVPEAVERLTPLATAGKNVAVEVIARNTSGAPLRAELDWLKAGNRKNPHWDNTVLGTMRIDPGRIVAEVNSAERADRLIRQMKRRLGAGATLAGRETSELTADSDDGGNEDDALPHAAPQKTAEIEAIEDEMFIRHLDAWVDMKIPSLRNRTPKQVSRTADGRERLDAIISGMSRGPVAERPARQRAIGELRKRLGLGS